MPSHSNIRSNQPLRRLSRWLALSAVLALTACASLSSKPPPEQVRQRATERWQALVGGEFNRAYTYTTPGFRAVVSPDSYRNRFGGAVIWLGSEVIDVNCPDTDRCVTHVRIDFKPAMGRKFDTKMSTHVDETWLLQEGQWWFFQDLK